MLVHKRPEPRVGDNALSMVCSLGCFTHFNAGELTVSFHVIALSAAPYTVNLMAMCFTNVMNTVNSSTMAMYTTAVKAASMYSASVYSAGMHTSGVYHGVSINWRTNH